MKILVSSKTLAIHLKEIDFTGGEYMVSACLKKESNHYDLILSTENKAVSIPVEVLIHTVLPYKQHNRRWDWVKELVSKVDEQPVTLEICEQIINVIFQY